MSPQRIRGFAWHLHHDVLVEWCYDYQKRVDVIIRNKPESEQDLRLRLFRMVQNVPAELYKAKAELDRAWADWGKTRAEWNVEALHAIECPDCPWDGRTIFPKR